MKEHFICTTDPEMAKQLRELGFVELAKEGDRYMFINDKKIKFSSSDTKVNYTDKLCF